MHEGEELEKLLMAHGKRLSHLADALEVSRSRVSQYKDMRTFPDESWRRISAGLNKLKIDPHLLRPAPRDPSSEVERVSATLDGLDQSQLVILRSVLASADLIDRLKMILGAAPEFRDRLRWVLEDRLIRSK
jgi:hypothetical protein